MLKHGRKRSKSIARVIELTDPVEAAKASGLRYVTDGSPGIARRHNGAGFRYLSADGKPLRNAAELRRIKSLAIPPAWKEVWICPSPNGHLQATGRDAKGRKQYRYHPRWREIRDQTKYDRMIAFGAVLPAIRDRVDKDLALPGLPRAKVIATVVKLLEVTLIRVGNEEYARQNRSFGLTTLRSKHVEVNGAKIRFAFRGKSGVRFDLDVHNRRLAKIVARCQDLPGQELFQYFDDDGELRSVTSTHINDYLREVTGQDFTAKDFRTWAGTVLAARALRELKPFESAAHAKRNVVSAIETVAKKLGNTRAVCRKCYIHPAVINAYMEGRIDNGNQESLNSKLPPEEAAVVAMIERQLTAAVERKSA
jgi:DNA topoisomerase-1